MDSPGESRSSNDPETDQNRDTVPNSPHPGGGAQVVPETSHRLPAVPVPILQQNFVSAARTYLDCAENRRARHPLIYVAPQATAQLVAGLSLSGRTLM